MLYVNGNFINFYILAWFLCPEKKSLGVYKILVEHIVSYCLIIYKQHQKILIMELSKQKKKKRTHKNKNIQSVMKIKYLTKET